MKNHLERYHKNEKDFHVVCQAPGCTKGYNDFEGYKTHLRRKHRDIMHKVIDDGLPHDDHSEANPGLDTCNDGDNTEDILSSSEEALVELPQEQQRNIAGDQQYDVLNEDKVKRLNAVYLLGTKENHKLTQRTVDTIVVNTTSIVQNSISLMRQKLWTRLDTAGLDFRAVPGLQEFFEELSNGDNIISNPFLGVETKCQQNAAFKKMFGLVVS